MRNGLRFGLLGPPVLYGAEGEIGSIGSRKTRALLAALLLEPGRVVSVDVLRDALWGGAPPASAQASLQNHVTRLRRLLDDPERLRAVPPGYVLRVGEGELDVRVFERHATVARDAYAERDWERALRESIAALALWRDTPLSGLPPETGGHAFVQRLEEARLLVLEWGYEAELRLDPTASRLDRLAPELAARTAEHPLRESFHRLLMLVLHRTGRQAEALAVHRDLRARLLDELGIEPGTAVRRAHLEILRDNDRVPGDVHTDDVTSGGSGAGGGAMGGSGPLGGAGRGGGDLGREAGREIDGDRGRYDARDQGRNRSGDGNGDRALSRVGDGAGHWAWSGDGDGDRDRAPARNSDGDGTVAADDGDTGSDGDTGRSADRSTDGEDVGGRVGNAGRVGGDGGQGGNAGRDGDGDGNGDGGRFGNGGGDGNGDGGRDGNTGRDGVGDRDGNVGRDGVGDGDGGRDVDGGAAGSAAESARVGQGITSPPRPAQLPPPPAHFTGREDVRDRLLQILDPEHSVRLTHPEDPAHPDCGPTARASAGASARASARAFVAPGFGATTIAGAPGLPTGGTAGRAPAGVNSGRVNGDTRGAAYGRPFGGDPVTGLPRVAVISGMAGVGKSALALHVAHGLRERFTDGQLYVNLHGATPGMTPLTAGQALVALLRDLGRNPGASPSTPTRRRRCSGRCSRPPAP